MTMTPKLPIPLSVTVLSTRCGACISLHDVLPRGLT